MKPLSLSRLIQVPLFQGLSPEEFEKVAAISTLHKLDRGERIHVNEITGALYIILAGTTNVVRTQNAHETFLFGLEQGEFYGGPPIPYAQIDQMTELVATSAIDLLEIPWEPWIEFLGTSRWLPVLFLERIMVAATEKFVYLSREYSHMVKERGVSADEIGKLFSDKNPTGEP